MIWVSVSDTALAFNALCIGGRQAYRCTRGRSMVARIIASAEAPGLAGLAGRGSGPARPVASSAACTASGAGR
eukprot:12186111-Alexandrium_andersonii.AAC.1